MPIEIRELVIRASVDEDKNPNALSSTDNKPAASRRLNELDSLKKLIEQKNER